MLVRRAGPPRRQPRVVLAWLIIEVDESKGPPGSEMLEALGAALLVNGRQVDRAVILDPGQRDRLWRIREDGAGLSARPPEGPPTWAGWEDSAVAPERLGGYLRALRALMQRHGIGGVMYGHFGAGCVHIRFDFDLETVGGRAAMAAFVRDAAQVVADHGGTVSGEHGDGRARSELLRLMYSAEILRMFASIKSTFDPDASLNPGIIVAPTPLTNDLIQIVENPRNTMLALHADAGSFSQAVGRCIGVGRCRSHSGGFMCPSFRATGEELDSTRGRARALQELASGTVSAEGWRSNDVRDALDLCLSCKACSVDCPVGVDVATYKAEFTYQHYRRRLRPMSHYSLGWLPLWIRIVGRMARPVNAVLRVPVITRVLRKLGGVTQHRELPAFHDWNDSRVRDSSTPALGTSVVLFRDSFTRGFRPELLGDAVRVLREIGHVPTTTKDVCCGITWISTGQLGIARRVLRRTVEVLDATGDTDIVVLEPSCASTLRTDAIELLDSAAARRVAARVRTMSDLLASAVDEGWRPPRAEGDAGMQIHCHERAVFGAGSARKVADAIGLDVLESEGCCGLAGNFGFERDHYDTSMAVAATSIEGVLEKTPGHATVIADGFSCQTQIDHVAGVTGRSRHLVTMIADLLR
jgi:Fe-S oxidoreductase